MSHNPRTPFDDFDHTGGDDFATGATQPLPRQRQAPPTSDQQTVPLLQGLQTGQPTGNYLNAPAAPPPASAPVPPAQAPFPQSQFPAPRPAAPRPAPPPTSSLRAPTSRLKVPLPTLLGGAVAFGAVLAVAIPLLIGRLIPKAPIKEMPPAIAVAPPAQGAGEPVEMPTAAGGEAPVVVPPEPEPEPQKSEQPSSSAQAAAPEPIEPSNSSIPPAGSEPPGEEARDSAAAPGTSESDGPRDREERTSSAGASAASYAGDRYEIAPPSGWSRSRSGRRTVWEGPGGAQLLVEVASDTAASPREDWEKLDRGFRKQYGKRYRSLGIRETTLAGRPAAVWEFELDSKSGRTTRKIDVAVHEGGRGYAVLGSAPADKFEEARPHIEEAIASFRLRSSDEDPSPEQPERRRRVRLRRDENRDEVRSAGRSRESRSEGDEKEEEEGF